MSRSSRKNKPKRYPPNLSQGARDARSSRCFRPRGQTVADKAYDADDVLTHIAEGGVKAVIPPKRNRKQTREFDRHQ